MVDVADSNPPREADRDVRLVQHLGVTLAGAIMDVIGRLTRLLRRKVLTEPVRR
jgi:hypothetical protein